MRAGVTGVSTWDAGRVTIENFKSRYQIYLTESTMSVDERSRG